MDVLDMQFKAYISMYHIGRMFGGINAFRIARSTVLGEKSLVNGYKDDKIRLFSLVNYGRFTKFVIFFYVAMLYAHYK